MFKIACFSPIILIGLSVISVFYNDFETWSERIFIMYRFSKVLVGQLSAPQSRAETLLFYSKIGTK